MPLFTELPRRGVPGKWASGIPNSRKSEGYKGTFTSKTAAGAGGNLSFYAASGSQCTEKGRSGSVGSSAPGAHV